MLKAIFWIAFFVAYFFDIILIGVIMFEKEELKKVAQELFEMMDFGTDTVVGVEKWNIIIDNTDEFGNGIGALAELSILVDEVNSSDIPSIPCVVNVLFEKKTGKAVLATCENEYGDPNGVANVELYYAKKEAECLEKELNEASLVKTKKLKI